jgi:MFS family permease
VRLQGTTLGYVIAAAIATGEGGLGVVLTPYLKDNGLSVPAIGAFVALYALAGLASRVPGGRWYRPGWVRRALIAGLLIQFLAGIAFPLFHDGWALATLRIVSGFGYGLGSTVNLAQFLDSLPAAGSREQRTAYFTAANSGGFALGNVTAGFLADHFGFTMAFVGVALYPLLAAIVTLFAAEPPVRRAAARGATSLRLHLRALGEPLLLIVLIEGFLLQFLFGMQYALFPLYLLAAGVTLAELGVMRGTFSGTQVASRLGAGWLTAHFGHRRVAAGGLAAQILALAVVPLTTNLVLLAALQVAFGGARGIMMMANTLGLAKASDRTTLSRGACSASYNAANDLGILLGPLLTGGVAGVVGLGNAFAIVPLGVLTVYVASVWLNGRRPEPAPRPAK